MGTADRRNSRKMRRLQRQRKFKLRCKRQAVARHAARRDGAKGISAADA